MGVIYNERQIKLNLQLAPCTSVRRLNIINFVCLFAFSKEHGSAANKSKPG